MKQTQKTFANTEQNKNQILQEYWQRNKGINIFTRCAGKFTKTVYTIFVSTKRSNNRIIIIM